MIRRLLVMSLPVTVLLLSAGAVAFVDGQALDIPPGVCWEIDTENKAPFKVGDAIYFGRIPALEEMGAIGKVSGFNLEWGLICIRPTGDPHEGAYARRVAEESITGERTADGVVIQSPGLRVLKASHPGPLCVAGNGKGSELCFPINTPGLQHLKRVAQ